MNSLHVATLVFGSLFSSAMLGLILQRWLPEHHLSANAKDTVKIAMGLVATMTALVLGLLVASAKGSYDTQRNEVILMAAKTAFLDRILTVYGPESMPTRTELRGTITSAVERLWSDGPSQGPQAPAMEHGKALYDALQKLQPRDDSQRALKSQAAQIVMDLGQMRWLLYAQSGTSISKPLLLVVVSWLTFTFLSFGLFAPHNATVIGALLLASFSVAGSILLILELDRPFTGLIQIPSETLRHTLGPAVPE